VIFRDRVTYGRRCVAAMFRSGLDPVVVDHGSTWPDAVDWLDCLACDEIPVLYRGGGHPRELWAWPPFTAARGDDPFLVTDPDVIPAAGCPLDWPQHLLRLLEEYPGMAKAALGLRIDNLPAHYSRRDQVTAWEAQFWTNQIGPGVYGAPVDTTLALYRPGSGFVMDAIRTGPPYVADHLAWHENLEHPTEESDYYYRHAEPGISHWAARGHSAWGN